MFSRGGATVDRDAVPAPAPAPARQVAGERRHANSAGPSGLPIRNDDVEPQRGIRYVAWLFKSIAGLLVIVLIVELWLALSDPAGFMTGALLGEAVRMIAFAGLLWGGADLALMLIHSHYDLRASRILLMRQTTLLERIAARGVEDGPGADLLAEPADRGEFTTGV